MSQNLLLFSVDSGIDLTRARVIQLAVLHAVSEKLDEVLGEGWVY